LREGATLLDVELPEPAVGTRFLRSRVGDAVAKGAGRDVWISHRAMKRIQTYEQTDRRDAVRRARMVGRYDELAGMLLVTGTTRRRSLQVVDEAGQREEVALDELDAAARRRLFRETPEGLEPASLWLNEAGLPMLPSSWQTVFLVADRRCARQEVPIRCHPHMLRHSFALRMLVTLTHAFDRRLGLTPEERREYRLLFGDPFVLVQTMLGHSSAETTRNIYLEPVNGLQVEMFLNGEDVDDAPVSSLLSRIAADAPQINDGAADAG
jgi:integrase